MDHDAGRLLGRGIAFPPAIGRDGRWEWSAGDQNVRESVRIILMTRLRERLMLPTFGGDLDRFLFEPNTVATRHQVADRITRALTAWEPRLRLQSVDVEEDPADPQAAVATITYTLAATGGLERTTLSVNLAG